MHNKVAATQIKNALLYGSLSKRANFNKGVNAALSGLASLQTIPRVGAIIENLEPVARSIAKKDALKAAIEAGGIAPELSVLESALAESPLLGGLVVGGGSGYGLYKLLNRIDNKILGLR